jgi:hypothetical protein
MLGTEKYSSVFKQRFHGDLRNGKLNYNVNACTFYRGQSGVVIIFLLINQLL